MRTSPHLICVVCVFVHTCVHPGVCRMAYVCTCVFQAIFEVQHRIQEAMFCLIRQHTHTPGCDKSLRYQLVVWR